MTDLNRETAELGEFSDDAHNENDVSGRTITSITPSTAEVGSADLTLTVSGTGFEESSEILFNGGAEPTTFVSETELTTTVKPSTASGAATVPVTVEGADGSVDFTFTDPVPPEVRSAPPGTAPKSPGG